MTDHLPSKDQVRLDALEHRLLSEEQESRASDIEHKLRFGWARKKAARLIVDLRDEIERLQHKLDTCGLECSATLKSLVAENEELRRDLVRTESARKAILGENAHYKQRAAEMRDKYLALLEERAAQPPGDGQCG